MEPEAGSAGTDAPAAEPLAPLALAAWCLACHYNLYGLTIDRCPECGRAFDRSDPATYSHTPRPGRFQKLVRRTTVTLADLLRENARLKLRVDLLVTLLAERGVITPEDATRLTGDLADEAAAAAMAIVDDTERDDVDEGDIAPTSDLLDLGRAAHDGRAEPDGT